MGRLSGFTADDVLGKLRRAGFVFDRQAKGSHEIWWNPVTRAQLSHTTPVTCLKEQCTQSCVRPD